MNSSRMNAQKATRLLFTTFTSMGCGRSTMTSSSTNLSGNGRSQKKVVLGLPASFCFFTPGYLTATRESPGSPKFQ